MEFNREQQQAMEHKDGPMLVLAGPGSGKTEVIIRRTRKLIQNYQVAPHLSWWSPLPRRLQDR